MTSFVELREIVQVVMRKWWVVALAGTLAALAGYLYSIQQTPVYRATTTLAVGRTIQASNVDRYDLQISEELALTYADVARRQPVLQATVDELDLDQSWEQVRSRLTVKPVENTQLLEISIEADSPETARTIADEIAQQLIVVSPTSAENKMDAETRDFVRQRLDHLEANIESAQGRIERLESDLTGMAILSVEQLRERQAEIEGLDVLIATWETAYGTLLQSLRDQRSPNYLAVLEPAQATRNPVRPRTKLNVLIAALAGAVVGLGLIFWREYTVDTFRSAEQAELILGLPSLGSVSRGRRVVQNLEVAEPDTASAMAEDCRMLRSKLLSMMKPWPRKVILVTSPSEAEGKSIIIAALGSAMARFGLSTIIVDANLRNPTQDTLFRLYRADGLTEELHPSQLQPPRRLKQSRLDNLRVLTSGKLDMAAPDRLGSQRMSELLTELAEEADVVLVDAPDSVNVADTLILAPQVDGVLLVIDAQTRRDTAVLAVNNLQMADANVVGFVLNRASAHGHIASLVTSRPSATPGTITEAPSPAET